MTRYIKFDAYGRFTEEAPKSIIKDDKLILGYNKETNEAMLLADGYLKYTGTKPVNQLFLLNGEIAEPLPDDDPIIQKIFTKLQIRRAMRKMGIENRLDEIISGNIEVQKDWNDAQVIDLDDEVFNTALVENGLTDNYIQAIIDNIEEQ